MFGRIFNNMNAGLVIIIFLVFAPSYADDVTDSIDEGIKYYKAGEFSDAVLSLNYAVQLIQQKKGASMESLLPEPLKGRKADDATTETAAASMMGGMVTAERRYTKGSSSVSIQIITDSPVLQGLLMMFANPMFASSDGGKLERIKKQKAIVKYDEASKEGEIQIVVANRFFVQIDGNGATKDDLIKFAEAIDYKKIESQP